MKHIKLMSSGGILLAVVLFLALNALNSIIFKSARVDLTDNNLYTLSQGTKNILQSLQEPITFRLYYSDKLATGIPPLSNYAKRVRELLEEYASVSGGKVKLIVSDPEPFSDAEDQAVQYGLQGVPVDNAGSVAYFGLVGTNSTDDKETIPFFQLEKEASLEYDITGLAYKLTNPKKHVVGLLSTLPIDGGAPTSAFTQGQDSNQPWMIVTQLRQMFEVRTLQKDVETIPTDVDVLMLVHPKGLSDKTIFAIDQFVLGGGHALVFADPYAETDQPPVDPQNPMAGMMASKASEFDKLLNAWGVELVNGQLAGDIDTALRVNVAQGPRPQAVEYVLWMQLQADNISKQDFITTDLKDITMATAGILKPKAGSKVVVTPLLQTSTKGMSIPTSRVQFRPDPMGLLNNYRPGNEKITLAARITGPVQTAFPDGKPGDAAAKTLKASQAPINVIVIADTDMLQDRFWVNVQNFFGQRIAVPRANNGALVINAVENLAGSNDLISLRSRGDFSRPFEKVKAIQRDAEKNFREREKQLQAKLQETERKINELQQQKGAGSALILSPEQQSEITQFRDEQIKTRKALRNVQHELRKNIEQLGTELKFINIVLLPLLIVIGAIALGIYRHRRTSHATA